MNKSPKLKKNKSISDKLADIFIPAPLLDPETDLNDETAAKVRDYSSDDDGEDDDNVQEFNQQLSDIRKKNVPLLADVDAKYRGQIASRKDFDLDENYGSDSEEQDQDEEEVYENSESDDDGSVEEAETTGFSMRLKNFDSNNEESVEDEDNDDGSDIEDENDEDDESMASNDSGANVDNDDSESDSEGDDESDFDGGDMFPDSNDDNQSSSKNANETSSSSTIKPSSSSIDIQKGYSVQNQLKIWEKLLEMRIHTQKVLIKANSMPTFEKFQNLSSTNQSFADLAQTTSKNVENLLDKMCEMQQLLVKQYPETKSLATKRKSPNNDNDSTVKSQRLSNEIQKSFEQYTPYRDATITKWHDRTKILTPGLKSSKSNPFNVIQSIRGVLANRQELIRKTQQHKGGYELFDRQQSTATAEEENCPADGAPTNDLPTAIEKQPEEIHCTEIYDDTDFYHTQLRELIEFKANSSNNMGDMTKQFIELQKLRNKIKKVVDTRASKGRKIRYVVHNKMINFMAQNADSKWTDDAKDELFSSLFGAKTQSNTII